MDVREKDRKFKRGSKEQGRALMNLHNNEAGRRVNKWFSCKQFPMTSLQQRNMRRYLYLYKEYIYMYMYDCNCKKLII